MAPIFRLIIGILLAAILTAGGFMLLSGALTPAPEPSTGPRSVDERYRKPPDIVPDIVECDCLGRTERVLPPDEDFSPSEPPDGPDTTEPWPRAPNPCEDTTVITACDPVAPGPIPIIRTVPKYPREEIVAGREGDVTLEFTIAPDGAVQDIVVVEATSEAFALAASEAVAQWRYNPRTVNGRPVAVTGVRITIEFRLSGEEEE